MPLVQPIGEAIDESARRLALWDQDRDAALYYLLTAFEDLVRLPVADAVQKGDLQGLVDCDAERTNLENALTRLVRWAYRYCPSAGTGVPPALFDWGIYEDAQVAIGFACRYDAAVTAIESTLNERQGVVVDGDQLCFSMLGERAIDYEAVSRLAESFRTTRWPHAFTPLALLLDPLQGPEITKQIRDRVRQVDDTRIEYTMTSRLESFFCTMAEGAVVAPDLPAEIEVHGYSIADFQRFYCCLYERAAATQCFCWMSGQVGMGVGSLALLLTRQELENLAVRGGQLSAQRATAIISDLAYDDALEHTDVFFQPLLEIAPDRYLISPMVVTASNWERNLQRLWSLKYADEYSARAGAAKFRLAETVSTALSRHGFVASANRELCLPNGQIVTEVDVAACDPPARVLLLAEVKWPIEPAEPREVRKADRELAKGLDQVRTATEYVRQHADLASRQLFPQRCVDIDASWQVRAAVIGRGHVGSACILSPDIPILDFHLTRAFLQSDRAKGLRLGTLMDELEAILTSPESGTNYAPGSFSFELAGYHFDVPSYGLLSPRPFAGLGERPQQKTGRNAPCPCGSGRKYKYCHGRRAVR